MLLDLGILAVTLLLMVTVGMELETRDFREVARRKGVLLWTLLLPAILLPGLGFALARALAGVAFVTAALLAGPALAYGLRLSARDGVTVAILLPVRNVALASAIAVALLNRLEFAVFAVVYFLTEVPLLLGAVGAYRRWWVKAPRLEA
jgi:bile acid:Na+ symporter, BASS family